MAITLAQAQTWTTLTNKPPAGIGLCMLLTDGGAMCQSGAAWYKLTPDINGSYVNGAWSSLASLPSGYNPDAFASAVLADGRVVVLGGEYNNGGFALTNMDAIYDPSANSWTMLTPPTTGSPNHFQCIGDAPSTVLADGRLIIGSKLYQDLAILDPGTLSWSIVSASGKTDGFNSEEGWTLLPDGSFFTLDVKNAPATERFLLTGSTTGVWAYAGATVQDLHTPTHSGALNAQGCPTYYPPGEVGPTLLRPDGTVFAIGADGFTGIYTPPPAGTTAMGSWAQGPQLPTGLDVEDGPAAVLPSGHVLFGGSPGASGGGLQYFEFDGTSLITVPAPARASGDATYFTSLLVLPSAQVMFVDGSSTVQLYTPASSPTYDPAWAPTIGSVPQTINGGTTVQISGTQFNGLDQGSAFGDESQNASNYPLVRITNNNTGHVFYAKTHDHSSMGVATGATTISTNFDVPSSIEAGASSIQVVANGIPSAAVAVTVVNPITYKTATTVSASPNPSALGQLVTITSTTTSSGGVPVGTVTFTEGATVWASSVPVNGSGQASFSTTNFGGGSHIITAAFTGANGWANSSGSASPKVTDFTISVSPTNPSTKQGQSTTPHVTVGALYGFTGNVALSVTGTLPAGLTTTFSPSSITKSGNSNLTLTPNGTPAGTYTLTVTGTCGALSHSATLTLTVSLGGNISMTANPATVSVSRSTNPSGNTLITIASSNGFAGTVNLTANGLPGGVTASFNTSSVSVSPGNPGTATMTLSVSPTTNTGNSNVNVTGNSGGGGPQAQTKVVLQVGS